MGKYWICVHRVSANAPHICFSVSQKPIDIKRTNERMNDRTTTTTKKKRNTHRRTFLRLCWFLFLFHAYFIHYILFAVLLSSLFYFYILFHCSQKIYSIYIFHREIHNTRVYIQIVCVCVCVRFIFFFRCIFFLSFFSAILSLSLSLAHSLSLSFPFFFAAFSFTLSLFPAFLFYIFCIYLVSSVVLPSERLWRFVSMVCV